MSKWQNSYKEAGQYRFKAHCVHVKAPNNIYNEFLRFFLRILKVRSGTQFLLWKTKTAKANRTLVLLNKTDLMNSWTELNNNCKRSENLIIRKRHCHLIWIANLIPTDVFADKRQRVICLSAWLYLSCANAKWFSYCLIRDRAWKWKME